MSQLKRTLKEIAWYPEHDPRRASPEYTRVHHKLVVEMDEPCWICGVRHSTGGRMETHHCEIEWAAEPAFENDPAMLARLVAEIHEKFDKPDELRQWLDSEGNLLVLCDRHHRAPYAGIHAITYPAWKLQKFQAPDGSGFQFVRGEP